MRMGESSPGASDSWEGRGPSEKLVMSKNVSGDQSLGSDCHGDQRRATLLHDYKEQASRASSSRGTTHIAPGPGQDCAIVVPFLGKTASHSR